MNTDTKQKLLKALKGAAIAGGGVALTYFLEAISSLDFGAYTAMVVGVASVAINALRLWLKKNNPQ